MGPQTEVSHGEKVGSAHPSTVHVSEFPWQDSPSGVGALNLRFPGWAPWSSVNLLGLYVEWCTFHRRVSTVSIRFSEGFIMLCRWRFANVVSESVSGIAAKELFFKNHPNSFVYSSLMLRTVLSDNQLPHVACLRGENAEHLRGVLGSNESCDPRCEVRNRDVSEKRDALS